jgi:hypothetical protein
MALNPPPSFSWSLIVEDLASLPALRRVSSSIRIGGANSEQKENWITGASGDNEKLHTVSGHPVPSMIYFITGVPPINGRGSCSPVENYIQVLKSFESRS